MDWMMGGKRMMQLSSPATSVHISDPLTPLHSSHLTAFLKKSPKVLQST